MRRRCASSACRRRSVSTPEAVHTAASRSTNSSPDRRRWNASLRWASHNQIETPWVRCRSVRCPRPARPQIAHGGPMPADLPLMTGPPRAHGSAPGHRGGDPLRDDPHTHPPGRSLRSTSTRSLPHHSQSTCYSATPRCAKTSRHSLSQCNNWHRASTPNGSKGSSPSWARRHAGGVEVASSQGWITSRVRFLSERRRRWSRWPSQATGRESVSPPSRRYRRAAIWLADRTECRLVVRGPGRSVVPRRRPRWPAVGRSRCRRRAPG